MVKTSVGQKSSRVAVKKPSPAKSKHKDSKTVTEIKQEKSCFAMPAILRVLVAVIFLIIFAGLFTWYILLQQNEGDADKTITFIQEQPVLTTYSYVIILLLMCVVAAATWRPFLTIGISFTIFRIIMYINTQKFEYRNAPLSPEDFLLADQAGTIMQFVDVWSVVRLISGAVLVIVGSGILECVLRRIFGPRFTNRSWWERHSIVPRITWTTIALAGLLMFARPVLHFDDKGNEVATDWIKDLRFVYWNPKEDYAHNGFIVAFLHDLGRVREQEPEEYSKDAIAKIAKTYTDASSGEHEFGSLGQVADNVIVVLCESFMDPEILGDTYAHTGGDPVPNLHEIFEKYPSGYMYSPEYGGGTANIEFSVLTSLSNNWARSTPYVTSLPKINNIPGIIGETTNDGFTGTAIHSFDGSMYKRSTIYASMGIQTFLDESSMAHTRQENDAGYISDRAVYQEVMDVLQDGEDKHMVMVVTMQNHVPYDSPLYEERNFEALGLIDDPYNAYIFGSYLESLYHSDQYLGEFIAALDDLEERTVMLWFGDHAPAVLGDYTDSGAPELVNLAHLTPYFIYANFDIGELHTEAEVQEMNVQAGFEIDMDGVDLPIVTPNCLASMVYQLLDVEMPPLVKLSSKACVEAPILAPTYVRDENESENDILRDYRLVNYDILSGKRYWFEV